MRLLVVHKKSLYQKFVLDKNDQRIAKLVRERDLSAKRIHAAHVFHTKALESVKKDLEELGIDYKLVCRDLTYTVKGYDLILSIGGDGTFLEASHHAVDIPLLGINSSPRYSVGYFCRTTPKDLKRFLKKFLKNRRVKKLQRLCLTLNGKTCPSLTLNEILITNIHPAGTSRYILKIGKNQEEHKSSGIWVAPAAGSTAALCSAGGHKLPLQSQRYQYVVREPYQQPGRLLKLKKGVLNAEDKLEVISKMDNGAFYIDGPHIHQPLKRGDRLTIQQSKKPLLMVW